MGVLGKAGVGLVEGLAVGFHPPDVAGHLAGLGELEVLDHIGNFVGHHLPPLAPVVGDGVGVEVGEILPPGPHVGQGLLQQLVHQPQVGILRVSSHPGQAAHGVGSAKNARLHGVDRHLGDQGVPVKPADHVGLFHGGELGADEFLLLPAHGAEFLVGDLEDVAQQSIVLLQVAAADGLHV